MSSQDTFTKLVMAKIDALFNELRNEMNANNKKLIEALVLQGILDMEEEMWTIDETAAKFKVSRSTIKRLIKDGILPASKSGESKQSPVRIRPADARQAMADYKYKNV